MGATDSVGYCQTVVEEVFGDLLGQGILCWLDDILGYAADAEALMVLLDQVLERCECYGLKLHANKCVFFATKVKWCGKMISAKGVRHCPERVLGLAEMQSPRTAGDLQQFLCAVNWMRQSIPEYNKLTLRLKEDDNDLAAVKAVLLNMVPLAHPSPDAEACLYTDASQDSWGAVVTQLSPEEVQLSLDQQHHRPLAFLSGRFSGASSRWEH
ncbi:unnamed protein product [Phytophthora fragariaefolia]|uniref:Unnamed protein product n=1 Tax=Phytophthora fragariaefolia TaxID=1490495 RepID=A0A9W6Y284_9STRA|nr:unnamed protein product [Phytophthora fragariaefolia]